MTVGKAISIRRRNGGPSSRLIQTFLREGMFRLTLRVFVFSLKFALKRCLLLHSHLIRQLGKSTLQRTYLINADTRTGRSTASSIFSMQTLRLLLNSPC